jgi:uncharacterized protein YaaR (DUF327 family)
MADKVSEMTDQEIKELMRAIAKANGRPLSEERIDADLPAYKNYLAAIERFTAHSFAMEDEPASSFSLRRFAPGKDVLR